VKNKEFLGWVLSLKPKEIKDKGISQQALYYQKSLIKRENTLNVKRVWDTIIVYLFYKNRNELRHCFIYKGTNL